MVTIFTWIRHQIRCRKEEEEKLKLRDIYINELVGVLKMLFRKEIKDESKLKQILEETDFKEFVILRKWLSCVEEQI